MTLIINKATIGYVDFEHKRTVNPTCLVALNDNESEYLHKKIKKLFNLNLKKILNIPNGIKNQLSQLSQGSIKEETFLKTSEILLQNIFDLKRKTDEPVNSHVLFVDFTLNENKFVSIILLENKKTSYFKPVKDNNGNENWVSKSVWQMPSASASIGEAVILDTTNDDLFILEKKVSIDGDKSFYLNEGWLMGEKMNSYRTILNYTLKVICKVKRYSNSDDLIDVPVHFKECINYAIDNKYDIIPHLIPKSIPMSDDELKEVLIELESTGIDENVIIPSRIVELLSFNCSKCIIKVDDEIEINMSIENYLSNKCKLVKDGDVNTVLVTEVTSIKVA